MRLAKATFKKVGPFKDFSIEFKKNKRKDLAEVHILTGPNGSGKSTILRGLSRAFVLEEEELYVFSHLFWTSRTNESYIEVSSYSGESISFSSSKHDSETQSPVVTTTEKGSIFNQYFNRILGYRRLDKQSRFEFGAFGYSGKRPLGRHYRGSDSGSDEGWDWSPFDKAVNFEREPDDELSFDEWVLTTLSKGALAFQGGDQKKYKAARFSLDRIEQILRDVTGRKFEFQVDLDVYEVVVCMDGAKFGLHLLPDGLKSILGWLGDLMMRMESIRWVETRSIFDQPIILFLDEIDIHLHPEWQKKILPIIQKTFVNAQIFVSTHSPFVVASVEDAYVYDLNIGKDGYAFLENVIHTEKGQTYSRVLKEIFDVNTEFADPWTEKKLDSFYELLKQAKSKNTKAYKEAFSVGKELAEASIELRDIVSVELNQLDRRIAAVK
ncbi:MAG: AAA family ATPase [Flavobacteriales bacterium]|nr:AAA family ATPase [Flavobacteriales bacterium]